MIRTITLNTGFDETVSVSSLSFGGVADLFSRQSLPSGKGINAGRVVRALGAPVVVYGLIGGAEHEAFRESLAEHGVESRMVEVDAPTRRNLTLAVKDIAKPAAHFRAPGFSLRDKAPIEQLKARLRSETQPGDIVSLHGSTPDGLDAATWTEIALVARDCGAQLLADVYGPSLPRLIASVETTCCKPNEHEVGTLPIAAETDAAGTAMSALHFMSRHQVRLPVVTLGVQGLLFAVGEDIWQAKLAPTVARVSVGAGDACAAGMLVALQEGCESLHEVARAGIAAAVAHVEATPPEQFSDRARLLRQSVELVAVGKAVR